MLSSELQIRQDIEDNSKVIFLISKQKHDVTPYQNRLDKTVLKMSHKIYFMEKYG